MGANEHEQEKSLTAMHDQKIGHGSTRSSARLMRILFEQRQKSRPTPCAKRPRWDSTRSIGVNSKNSTTPTTSNVISTKSLNGPLENRPSKYPRPRAPADS